MFRIKVCGVTDADDARMAADAGADAIGLNFFRGSPRWISPATAESIVAAVPEWVIRVGVFVNHDPDMIRQLRDDLRLDLLQLHGQEGPDVLDSLRPAWIVRAVREQAGGPLVELVRFLEACRRAGEPPAGVLLDAWDAGAAGGTGRLADWALASRLRAVLGSVPLVLAGGLGPDNVATAIAAVRPDAVDVASGVESTPGRKDAARVRRFVEAARAAWCRG